MQSATLTDILYPPRTAMEVFDLLPEGTLAEVINNILYMPPAPTFEHQDLLGDLFVQIRTFINANNLGKCVSSPVDVYLGNNNAVQPDLLFILKENLGIVQKGKIRGVPDLIVEILSGDKKHDLERKKNLYEAFGVKEYFIVDQTSKDVIAYFFKDGKFILQKTEAGKINSELLNQAFSF